VGDQTWEEGVEEELFLINYHIVSLILVLILHED